MVAMGAAKRVVGEHAASLVESGMQVGLGTGSTAAFAIAALGRRVREEGLQIVGVATSFAAERLARAEGIPLVTLDDVDRLDLVIDGADEVDPALNLIKGGGGAHTRERIVAAAAERFVVVADASKLVERLGTRMPVPVEVLPMAVAPVMRGLAGLGATPELRLAQRKDGPVVTDQGFWIVDAFFAAMDGLPRLARSIREMPGVLDHGLFLGMATEVLVGEEGGAVRTLVRQNARS